MYDEQTTNDEKRSSYATPDDAMTREYSLLKNEQSSTSFVSCDPRDISKRGSTLDGLRNENPTTPVLFLVIPEINQHAVGDFWV